MAMSKKPLILKGFVFNSAKQAMPSVSVSRIDQNRVIRTEWDQVGELRVLRR